MNFVLFYHSLLSDWNHGNAHFLRGMVGELLRRGHAVTVYEPRDSWSLRQLREEHGTAPLERFRAAYPGLDSLAYDLESLDLERALNDADVVVVHEWNAPELVNEIGRLKSNGARFHLLFHDTHHRLVTEPESMARLDLAPYDGVLAYGKVLRDLYLASGKARRAWIWHEAADTRVFCPRPRTSPVGDLVWVGNWGDEERSEELHEFLIQPVKALGLKARVYGVRYPEEGRRALADAGIEYAGWLPNFEVPAVFAQFHVTVHVPRRPYVKALPGIPTIRVFEALACGIPLVCSPWEDTEGLFNPGRDYLVVRTGKEMKRALRSLLEDKSRAQALAQSGLETIRARHTCGHRAEELLQIINELRADSPFGNQL